MISCRVLRSRWGRRTERGGTRQSERRGTDPATKVTTTEPAAGSASHLHLSSFPCALIRSLHPWTRKTCTWIYAETGTDLDSVREELGDAVLHLTCTNTSSAVGQHLSEEAGSSPHLQRQLQLHTPRNRQAPSKFCCCPLQSFGNAHPQSRRTPRSSRARMPSGRAQTG